MLLLEIAAQGVKGLSLTGGSVRLRPGYNVVGADGGAVRRLLEALLYPDGPEGEALRNAASGTGSPRGGVTLVGRDGVTYRVVRDFAANCQLHRFDPQRRSFALVAQAQGEVAEKLTGAAGVPTRALFSLLSLSAGDLPSRRRGFSGSASAPPRRTRTAEETQKRLGELKDELERSKVSEKLQYQLDGLQSRLFKLEEALKEEARAREEIEKAEAALASVSPAAAAAAALGDVDAKLAAYAKAVAKRDETLARIASEREALATANQQGPAPSFWMDARFWTGVGAGILALVVGMAFSSVQGVRYLALLDIPAFGWAAWVALGWVRSLEEHGRLGRRLRLIEEHEKKVQDAFEREAGEVRAAVKAAGVADLRELRETLNKLADAQGAVAQARQRLVELQERPEARAAKDEKGRVESELKEVESQLAGTAGGYVRDARSVEAEIQRLEAEPVVEEEASTVQVITPAAPADPIRDLLERAAGELGGSAAAAARGIQPRAAQMVQALSASRLGGMAVDDRGNLAVQVGGRACPLASLPLADTDLAFVALKLSVVERILAAGKRVALFDDGLSSLPEGVRRVVGRILKQIARPGQLLHFTVEPHFRESADHVA